MVRRQDLAVGGLTVSIPWCIFQDTSSPISVEQFTPDQMLDVGFTRSPEIFLGKPKQGKRRQTRYARNATIERFGQMIGSPTETQTYERSINSLATIEP